MSFLHDFKIAVRSLSRVPALWITVALTLALGIGANAAIFSVVRAVLLRPLANRDEDRLLSVRGVDKDLAASLEAMHDAEERLRVTAHATTRTRIMGVERAVSHVIREVQVTIPKLTDERLSQMYLPPVRERMKDVERALADRAPKTT